MILYNEIDEFCVKWLANLATGPLRSRFITISPMDIRELEAGEVAPYTQAHFFAGIGGWPLALRMAGWPDDRPIWTGSCPCQPFSAAGRRRGFDDDRHLWPTWFRLIRECSPPVIFGEQVASPLGLGWFDAVRADLEGEGYAVGASDLCAAGVGAPHVRQRLYFVAVADGQRRDGLDASVLAGRPRQEGPEALRSGEAGALADTERGRGGAGWPSEAHGRTEIEPDRHGAAGGVGDTSSSRGGRDSGAVSRAESASGGLGQADWDLADVTEHASAWADPDWILCADGKARSAQPGTFPLAHGVPGRVGKLRAYGNAVVPQVAATFIRAVMDVI